MSRKQNRKEDIERSLIKKQKEMNYKVYPSFPHEGLKEAMDKAPGTTERQREASRIKILREQLELRGVKTSLTEKGRKETSDEYRRVLTQLLEEEMEKETADQQDGKPPIGTKLRHKLQDEHSEAELWYGKGEIVNATENTLTISYNGYEDNFTWYLSDNKTLNSKTSCYFNIYK